VAIQGGDIWEKMAKGVQMKTMVYVFGQPGSGKTTLVKKVCEAGRLLYQSTSPIKHQAYASSYGLFTVLGADVAVFGGTDTLSYTALSDSACWLKALSGCAACKLVIAEGDRLANLRFFQEAAKYYRLKLFYLDCADEIARKRREARASKNGLKMQSVSWVKGRVTKNKNLAVSVADCQILDAARTTEELARQIWDSLTNKEFN